jgi:hypothetical protein
MRKNLLVSLTVSLFLVPAMSTRMNNTYGQEVEARVCADVPGQTSGTHRFRVGETIEIALRGEGMPASVADCEPVELKLNWANGRNNGAMFNITFLDDRNSAIYTRQIPGFLPGVLELPLSSFATQPGNGASLAMISVPTKVRIQAVEPFAAPAVLSYVVTRVAREPAAGGRSSRQEDESSQGNRIVSVHNATRLIGSSRVSVIQIELITSHPFPVRDFPLQLQIGKKIFVDELSGDYTGRRLTLSLTPEMFAELRDGDEVVAFFGKPDGKGPADGDAWHFGKLAKSRIREE